MNTRENQTAFRQPEFTTREDEQGIHLLAALPGVRKEDLKLTVKDGQLTIEAVRDNLIPENWTLHSAPTAPAGYRFTARLAPKFDGAGSKATFENGVLTLSIPLREESKAREISVN